MTDDISESEEECQEVSNMDADPTEQRSSNGNKKIRIILKKLKTCQDFLHTNYYKMLLTFKIILNFLIFVIFYIFLTFIFLK